jgi:putative DNA primase/helicase
VTVIKRKKSNSLIAAGAYFDRGWQPIPIPVGEKAPRLKNWPNRRFTRRDLPSYFGNGQNVGILLGEVSRGLLDVDLDAPQALIVADTFLPVTGQIHGRKSNPRSHWWYFCTPCLQSERFTDLDGSSLVEIRSTGLQTVVPPSIHPSGEEVQWDLDGEPATVNGLELRRAVTLVASVSLLARRWPNRGQRHEAALALAGMLTRGGWPEEEAERFVRAVAVAGGDEEWRTRVLDVCTTVRRLERGESATGARHLAEIVGKEVVDRASSWLELVDVTPLEFRCTDVGNAERFAARFANELRFCYDWGEWLFWDGARWRRDQVEVARLRAAEMVRDMRSEAAKNPDASKRESLWRWACRSEHTQRLSAALREAQPQPLLRTMSAEFDCDPWLLNCRNGTLDLRTGNVRPFRPLDMLTKLAGASYDAQAQCPRWLQFIDEITAGRKDLAEFLRCAAGYALTGDTGEQVFFLMHGVGANGKTTFLETLREILEEYATVMEFKTVLEKRDSGVSNDIARLQGARLVIAKEASEGHGFNESLLKEITGGDTISARKLYQEAIEFRPCFKLFLAANHKPVVRENSEALWRRVRLIPFDAHFRNPDKGLIEKLLVERNGILAWAVRGCLQFQVSGLVMAPTVAKASTDYRDEMDVIGRFIRTACEYQKNEEISFTLLYLTFQQWAGEFGERACSKKAFAIRLQELRLERVSKHARKLFYRGIRLSHEWNAVSVVSD